MAGDTSKTIKLLLLGEDKSASKAVEGVGSAASATGDKLDGLGKRASTARDMIGMIGGAAIAKGVVDFGNASVEAFRDADASQRQLEDAYTRFPALADVNIDKMRELSQAIQDKNGADADDLAAAQANLAQYQLTGAQISELTPLLVDYAAKTGTDLPTASEALGKAMLGSGKALKSVGIDFSDAGSVGANFDQVVSGLRTQVGGFADSEATTLDGKMKILDTKFGDIKESVGEKLVPVLTDLAEKGEEVIDWASRNEGAVTALGVALGVIAGAWAVASAASMVSGVAQAAQLATVAAGWVAHAAAATLAGAEATAVWLALSAKATASAVAQVAAHVRAAAGWAISHAAMMSAAVAQGVVTAAQWLMNAAMEANPIGLVVLAIAALAAGLIYAYKHSETFRTIVDGAFQAIAAAGTWMWNNVLQPVFSSLVWAFQQAAQWVAKLLDGLSNIPGFGWAKDAADKMRGAADAAGNLADKIQKIPDKTVHVTLRTSFAGPAASEAAPASLRGAIVGMMAGGGRPRVAAPYIVGEEGPELFVPDMAGTIIPSDRTAALLAGGAGPRALDGWSGVARLHPDDIRALGDVILAGASATALTTLTADRWAGAGDRQTRPRGY